MAVVRLVLTVRKMSQLRDGKRRRMFGKPDFDQKPLYVNIDLDRQQKLDV